MHNLSLIRNLLAFFGAFSTKSYAFIVRKFFKFEETEEEFFLLRATSRFNFVPKIFLQHERTSKVFFSSLLK